MQRASLLAAALAAGALTLPATAAAAPDVFNTFDALWYVDVSYSHKHLYQSPASGGEEASYRLTGSMTGVEFENQFLTNYKTVPIDGTVKASGRSWLDHPEGTSANCAGDTGHPKGFAVLGKEAGAVDRHTIWFAPIAGIEIPMECTDSDDRTYETKFTSDTIGKAPGGPAGSWARLAPTFAQVDTPQWEMPVNIKITADDCPDWDIASSVSCTLTATGTVKFFRTDRREVADPNDDLLAPVEPKPTPEPQEPPRPKAPKVDKPKLDRKAGRLRTGVSCEWNCEVGIGIFTHRKNGKPYVKPVKRRTVSVKGGGSAATTQSVSVPLSKAQLGKLPKGKAMTVTVTTTMAGASTTETFTVKG